MYNKKRHYTPAKRPQGQARPNPWRYEVEKQNWVAHHPNATGDEYVQAMREIAARCRI